MLTGQLPASGGDAVILGESVRSPGGMGEIRGNMGVCPQFDVLWNELTAREHMILFANIKGIATKEEIISEANTLISEVCFAVISFQCRNTTLLRTACICAPFPVAVSFMIYFVLLYLLAFFRTHVTVCPCFLVSRLITCRYINRGRG